MRKFWLQKLQWPLYSWKEAKSRALVHSDIVVMVSNIRIGKLKIWKWARKHRGILRDKALFVLAVGANPPDEQDYYIETAMKSLDFLDLKRENSLRPGRNQAPVGTETYGRFSVQDPG
ncbi:MAG: hypothetical protein U5N26_10760 [Candidatus Marinimicrobia bacterium]|nr:hypothetical protein [Candidatus Neomarinimicrobiota bacterium]